MTALGDDALSAIWSQIASRLKKPDAILMVSAHWTTRQPTVGGSTTPQTIHDFGGFPEELYRIRYPAPGAPLLAQQVQQALSAAGFDATIDPNQSLDHGAWVPLRILFPAADIPVLQLSVQPGRDARHHHALGAAIGNLAVQNILMIGSGHMTHNLREFMQPGPVRPSPGSRAFREWAHAQLMDGNTSALLDWTSLPEARSAHPTVEHFLPLFVVLGAAGNNYQTSWLGGGWLEESLAADNYLFNSKN